MFTAGGKLYDRFQALSGATTTEQSAYGSYEERKFLMYRAVDAIEAYPIFGIGVGDFPTYSGVWRDVHMTYLQVAAEGGIPVLIIYLLFFRKAFRNLKILRKRTDLDTEVILFVERLPVRWWGLLWARCLPGGLPVFPVFCGGFHGNFIADNQRTRSRPGIGASTAAKRGRHFLEVYADRGKTGAVTPAR